MRESCFGFLNRSVPLFSTAQDILKPREQRFIKIEAPFIYEISGLVIVKMLDKKAQSPLMIKLKYVRNTANLDVMNSSLETVIFNPKEMLGILDLRSMVYYNINLMVCNKT